MAAGWDIRVLRDDGSRLLSWTVDRDGAGFLAAMAQAGLAVDEGGFGWPTTYRAKAGDLRSHLPPGLPTDLPDDETLRIDVWEIEAADFLRGNYVVGDVRHG